MYYLTIYKSRNQKNFSDSLPILLVSREFFSFHIRKIIFRKNGKMKLDFFSFHHHQQHLIFIYLFFSLKNYGFFGIFFRRFLASLYSFQMVLFYIPLVADYVDFSNGQNGTFFQKAEKHIQYTKAVHCHLHNELMGNRGIHIYC